MKGDLSVCKFAACKCQLRAKNDFELLGATVEKAFVVLLLIFNMEAFQLTTDRCAHAFYYKILVLVSAIQCKFRIIFCISYF